MSCQRDWTPCSTRRASTGHCCSASTARARPDPADRGQLAARRVQPGAVPAGRERQPVPAPSGVHRGGAAAGPGRGGVEDPPGARRVLARGPGVVRGLPRVRRARGAGDHPLGHEQFPGRPRELRQPGADGGRRRGLPVGAVRLRPRRARVVVRRGRVPGPGAGQRVARPGRAAPAKAPGVLRALRFHQAGGPVPHFFDKVPSHFVEKVPPG